MAVVSTINCSQCKQTKNITHCASVLPTICDGCRIDNEEREKEMALDILGNKPIEERIQTLEEMLYDLQKEVASLTKDSWTSKSFG